MSINVTGVILGKYKGIEVKKPDLSVPEEAIQAAYEERKKDLAVIEEVTDRGIEPGDVAYIDFSASYRTEVFLGSHEENFPVKIGGEDFLPGFNQQLECLEAGDKINITVTMPEKYRDNRVAGKDITFRVTIKKVEKPVYPTYEEAREGLLADLTEEKRQAAESRLEDFLMEEIVEDAMIYIEEHDLNEAVEKEYERWVDSIAAQGFNNPRKYLRVYGSDADEQKEILKPKAEFRLKSVRALEAIAVAEGLTATQEEIDDQIAMIAAHFGMPPEVLKERFDDAALASVESDVMMDKALQFVKDQVIWV